MTTPIRRPPDPFARDRARLARYAELREFYDGGQWPGKPRRGEKRLVVNYARVLVRKVVSYVLPSRVGFSVPAPVGGRCEGEEGGRTLRGRGATDSPPFPPQARRPPPGSEATLRGATAPRDSWRSCSMSWMRIGSISPWPSIPRCSATAPSK